VTTPLEQGVAAAIEYYRNYGIEQTFTHLRVDEAPAAKPS
jgi:UDP-glucose 4-epimerase